MSVSDKPVMKSCCKTCPFKLNDKGVYQNMHLANQVIANNMFRSQQLCHNTRLDNIEETHRCFGYYQYSVEIYDKMGLEPKKHMK